MLKILILESDSKHKCLIRYLLEEVMSSNMDLHSCSDLNALDSSENYDVVIMDHSLIAMDAQQAVTDLRMMMPNSIVILAMEYATEELIEEALRAGANSYMIKGELSPEALSMHINTVLEKINKKSTAKKQPFISKTIFVH